MLRRRGLEVSQSEAHREMPFSDLPRIIEPYILHKGRNQVSGILFRMRMLMPVKEPCEAASGRRPPPCKIYEMQGPAGSEDTPDFVQCFHLLVET